MDINVHIKRVAEFLQKQKYSSDCEITEIVKIAGENNRMKIKAVIRFFDDSFLQFYEIVETGKCYPQLIRYSYQYMNSGVEIFRYDDKRHHPNIPTFPHHKHVRDRGGEQVIASTHPTAENLFREICDIIDNRINQT